MTDHDHKHFVPGCYRCDLGRDEERESMLAELAAVRAQLQADDQRAWESLGKPEGTYDTTNVQRLCAEVKQLRADLRLAIKLIGQAWSCKEPPEWQMEAWELLEKHKETP